jgi:hypothetical protein
LVASSSTTGQKYLDDILVYGDTPQEYLDNLQNLKRFKEYGVLLSPKKCSFGVPEVEYVDT